MSVLTVTGNVYFNCKYHSEELTDSYTSAMKNQADRDRITLNLEKLDVIPNWLADNDSNERYLFKYAFKAEIDETYHQILGGYKGDPEVKQFLKERFTYYNRNQAFYYAYMDDIDIEMSEDAWQSEINSNPDNVEVTARTSRTVHTINLTEDVSDEVPSDLFDDDNEDSNEDSNGNNYDYYDEWEHGWNDDIEDNIDEAIERVDDAFASPPRPINPRTGNPVSTKKGPMKKGATKKRAITQLEPKKKEFDEKIGAKRKIFVLKDEE